MMRKSIFLALATTLACWTNGQSAQADFGFSKNSSEIKVDTGAGLFLVVNRSNGDVTSWNFRGVEYRYDEKKRTSHINSGLGGDTTVSAESLNGNIVKVTIETGSNNKVAKALTHYLIVRKGENAVYMATHVTHPLPRGELRWITRLWAPRIPNGPVPSDLRNHESTAESADVFRMKDGKTRSKYYGDDITHGKDRAIDMTFCGARGDNVGIWMVYGNRESSSGGPFFRDIQNQCGSSQEIYNYMYSGHNQTEDWKVNVLHGPYALVFTDGQEPSLPLDLSWIQDADLNLKGWVSDSQRGTVSGKVSGIRDGFEKVVGFSNPSAQYWAAADADGAYQTPLMKPGDYDVTLYQQELEVATDKVTVSPGQSTQLDLKADDDSQFLWRLGDRDGTPLGFLNADKVIEMHPSDKRMADWNVGPFQVGKTDPGIGIPCYQWKETSGLEIHFDLTADQIVDSTVRFAFTAAHSGARPRIRINGLDKASKPSSQPNSRSMTIGTWRGNNKTYSFGVPKRNLAVGENILFIDPISGAGASGFLSAGYSLDYIEWKGPRPKRPAAPVNLTAESNAGEVQLNWVPEPSATHYVVQRSTDKKGPFQDLVANLATARFVDRSALVGEKYYYRVTAVNDTGKATQTLATTVANPLQQMRTWTDAHGNRQDAMFDSFAPGQVRLKLSGGRTQTVDLTDLGSGDQRLLLQVMSQLPRTWTDDTGKYTFDDAVFQGVQQGTVTLQANGKSTRLPMDRLSKDDQALIQCLNELSDLVGP